MRNEETPTKDCEYCHSKGFYLLHHDYIDGFNLVKLPRFTSCEYCRGLGYIDLTETEIENRIENDKYSHHEKF